MHLGEFIIIGILLIFFITISLLERRRNKSHKDFLKQQRSRANDMAEYHAYDDIDIIVSPSLIIKTIIIVALLALILKTIS